jgi:exopolysaccharide production protein ExoY
VASGGEVENDMRGHARAGQLAIQSRPSRALKRALDLVLALPLLVVTAPLVAVLALVVRLDSRGRAFFGQDRVGRGGRSIRVWKIRTMRVDAEDCLAHDPELRGRYEASGFKLAPDADPRLTRSGRLIRRFSLDELPQLWNVVEGSMSLVGPRPVLSDELEQLYAARAGEYLLAKPGLTGRWQVNGRSEITGVERADLDLSYVHDWSMGLDLRILLQTVPAVLHGRGAH